MKLLRIVADGLPLFKETLDISFYAKQRVTNKDKENLYKLNNNYYLNPTCAFIGINASGKTSILKVLHLALSIINNEPINHIESKNILGTSNNVKFQIYFYGNDNTVYCLETTISSDTKNHEPIYYINEEKLYYKPIEHISSKKKLAEYHNMQLIDKRNQDEKYLPDDVSFIIAHNKKYNEHLDIYNLMSITNTNILPFYNEIPLEIISFLDPTIEKLYFDTKEGNTFVHLKFFNDEEIILNNPTYLEQYLSSGTIKGIIVFSMIKDAFINGGYLLIDEIENHFNKEIVATIMRFFMDSHLNINGATLFFTTHYPELLDEYDRNDGINIVKNENGITVKNLSNILNRNDIKKSDAYQSGYLQGTTPSYKAYINLRKKMSI